MPLPLIVLAAGAAISAWGSISQGNAQAAAADEAARMREIEAQEVLERLKVNRANIFEQGQRFKIKQSQAIAASGRLTNDSTLSILEDTNSQVVKQIYSAERQANFDAASLRAEGQLAQSKGQEMQRAGYIGAFGTLLTGAFNASQNINKPLDPNKSPYSLSTWDVGGQGYGTYGSRGY